MTKLPEKDAHVTFERILAVVAKEYSVTRADIMGRERFPQMAMARHVAVYLARELIRWSFPYLGRVMNHKDHTSVMHAYYKVKGLVKSEGAWAKHVAELMAEVARIGPAAVARAVPVVSLPTDLPGLYAPAVEVA